MTDAHDHDLGGCTDSKLCYAEEYVALGKRDYEKSVASAEAIEDLISRGAENIPTVFVEIVIRHLQVENDGLRKALDETHAELVRLTRIAQY